MKCPGMKYRGTDLNVALYGNEGQFNVENEDIDRGKSFYYTKETCETDESRHEWSHILVLTRSGGPDFRSQLFESVTVDIHV